MNYGYKKQVDLSFIEAIDKVKEELSKEGFGVLTEIDVKSTLKKKIDVDYSDYVILGACNPAFAYKALQAEKEIGLLLPCNIIVYEDGGEVFASAILPSVAMGMVENESLPEIAKEVEDKLKKADKKGTVVKREDVLEEQIKYDLNYADIKNIEPFKIVIDTANAMGSLYFDALFKHLPCEVVKMNWKLDGTFPSHEADPLKPENMKDLGKKVLEEKADLGIATDGDGDRIFFTDNEGKIVEPGIARAILCKLFLLENPGAKIAYDIRPGRITPDTITENGGTPIVTRVGHSLIKTQAIKEGAVFAGESSGHFFLNMDEGCYEIPLIVTLKILEELSRSNQSFSNYIKPYKKYFNSGEINSEVSDPLAKITEIKNRYADAKQNELDGITIEYPDYWFNVRPSNTEPLLRLNLEAVSQEIMEEKRDELLKLIRG